MFYLLPNLLVFAFLFDHLCACKFNNSYHVSITLYLFNFLHFICFLFYPLPSCYLTIVVHFYVGFMLFIVLLYFIIFQRFSFYTCTIFLWHAVTRSYNVVVSFAFFVFVHHIAHCFLLLVSCILYVVNKHCLEEACLNRWVKHLQLIK